MGLEPRVLGAAYPQRLEHIRQNVLSHRVQSLAAEKRGTDRIRPPFTLLNGSSNKLPALTKPSIFLGATGSMLLHESAPARSLRARLAQRREDARYHSITSWERPRWSTLVSNRPFAASNVNGSAH